MTTGHQARESRHQNRVVQLAGGVAEGRLEIFRLKIRKLGEDLIGGDPSGIKIEHIAHADPHASDAGLAAALGWAGERARLRGGWRPQS